MKPLKSAESSDNDTRNETILLRALEGDPESRAEIISAHLPLVKRYMKKYTDRGVPSEDLYQEGCYGLLKALERYDPSRGTSFGTYAAYHVHKYIKKAVIEQNGLYPGRYNEDYYYELRNYIKTYTGYYETNNRYPSDEEMASILGISLKRVRNLNYGTLSFLSQSAEISQEHEIVSQYQRPVEDEVIASLPLKHYNAELTEREDEVLSRKFGYRKNGIPQTWAEISAEMNLSVYTLHQSFFTALEKLKYVFEDEDEKSAF